MENITPVEFGAPDDRDTSSPEIAPLDNGPERKNATFFDSVQSDAEDLHSLQMSDHEDRKEPTIDYFSLPVNRSSPEILADETYPQVSNFMEALDLAYEVPIYTFAFSSTGHLPVTELTHPTGSPLQPRDIISPPKRLRDSELKPVPALRGGGYDEIVTIKNVPWEDLPPDYSCCSSCAEIENHIGNTALTSAKTHSTPSSRSSATTPATTECVAHELVESMTQHDPVAAREAHHHGDSSPTNATSNAGDIVDHDQENVSTLEGFSSAAIDQHRPIFPPRSSSLQYLKVELFSDISSSSSERSSSLYSTDMPENKMPRSETPYLSDEESRRKRYMDECDEDCNEPSTPRRVAFRNAAYDTSTYRKTPSCGSDTPAPFAETEQTDEESIASSDHSDYDATTPRPSSPPIAFVPESKRLICALDAVDTTSYTLFQVASGMKRGELASLAYGLQVDIRNGVTGEVYVRNVPQRMLFHFCIENVIYRRLKLALEIEDLDTLDTAPSEAEKGGVVRVVRYLRRWCTSSAAPGSDLRVPPDIRTAIETIRACQLFGFYADAKRIQDLLVNTFMEGENWCMTDEHVEIIWDEYDCTLRETSLGDAIVWFILTKVQSGEHPLADEIKWMMEQEEYESLKQRVRTENMRKYWRDESRRGFLRRCAAEREETQLMQREKMKMDREIKRRVKETQMMREKRAERAQEELVSVSTSGSRQEASVSGHRLQGEQRSNCRSTKNAIPTQRSTRPEDRDHSVRKSPSTETQLSDLWNDQPDNKTSKTGTYKPFPSVSTRQSQRSDLGSRSGTTTKLPQPASLRTHRPDVPHPSDHRAVRRMEAVPGTRSARESLKLNIPSIPAVKAPQKRSSGFWKKLLAVTDENRNGCF